MTGMTDLHQHLLWGMDDGPQTPKQMHAMLRAAHRQGVVRIAATPHACPGFQPFDMALYRRRLAEAQAYCDRKNLGIQVVPGAEVAWTYNTVEALRRKQVPTLNDSEYVLIEFWPTVGWDEVLSAVRKLQGAGFTPVLAHVERYWCFTLRPGRAIEMRRELSVAYQVNATTVLSRCGPLQRRVARRLLDARAVDAVASDAHDLTGRRICMREAYRALKARCGAAYARKLVSFEGKPKRKE